jgi:flagellar biosynthesis protein
MTGYTPGSLAVALAYEAPGAPRVVAKGDGELGRRIIETAQANGVPIEHNAGLAAALSNVELDEEIPVELYKAAAEVIAFVLRLSRNR